MDHASLKKTIRREKLAARKLLSDEDVRVKSAAMFEVWKQHFFPSDQKFFHCFLSIVTRREPDTAPFIRFIRETLQGTLIIPVVDQATDRLSHAQLSNDMTLEKNQWGISEPRAGFKPVSASVPDMVLVPMLAYDNLGNRLGYGKGHYDRFLAATRPDCLKVGLCFSAGFVEEGLPSEEHDLPLDAVVTEERVWLFEKSRQQALREDYEES